MSSTRHGGSAPGATRLRKSVGAYGLMLVSLGSIIGSGWLLGALKAAQVAGPASLISWCLAAALLAVLALVHAELGAAYPVAGGTARFPFFAFGRLAGFVAGWTAWLQAVAVAPIEVEASLAYLDNIGWVRDHLNLLNSGGTLTASGFAWASVLMAGFTTVNILGVKKMSDSNAIAMIWKVAVPVITIVLLLTLSFHGSNFTAGGGFAPFGAHGVFAALPVGVVFALQGFEQAIQFAGEAKNPQRDISRAVIIAMLIGTAIYILLEIAFVGGLNPANLLHGWANPIGKGDFGPYATLATVAGAGWLAYLLYADAFVSPAATGLVYFGTASRLSYALGQGEQLPRPLAKLSTKGVPVWSVVLAFVIGEISFLPFPSWQSLVNVITSATAIMYGFAPVSLTALRLRDPDRPRPYKLPFAKVLSPVGFVAANLIVYWGGFDVLWKLMIATVVGLGLFALTRRSLPPEKRHPLGLASAKWVAPWLLGLLVIGFLGRYGTGAQDILPNWIDLIFVIVYSLLIFALAVRQAASTTEVAAAIAEAELDPEQGATGSDTATIGTEV